LKSQCPICNETFQVNKKHEGKVLLCPECESSLFVAKVLKEETKILPFSINSTFNTEHVEYSDDDDEEEDYFEFDAE
jgi:ssDNA-binding Zn-finger/Zn-ribbon topoisomerase 1